MTTTWDKILHRVGLVRLSKHNKEVNIWSEMFQEEVDRQDVMRKSCCQGIDDLSNKLKAANSTSAITAYYAGTPKALVSSGLIAFFIRFSDRMMVEPTWTGLQTFVKTINKHVTRDADVIQLTLVKLLDEQKTWTPVSNRIYEKFEVPFIMINTGDRLFHLKDEINMRRPQLLIHTVDLEDGNLCRPIGLTRHPA